MEVSRRRSLPKHLEPARPLRRCFHIGIEGSRKPFGQRSRMVTYGHVTPCGCRRSVWCGNVSLSHLRQYVTGTECPPSRPLVMTPVT
ncbi:hypothetical protein F2P81_001878 [Scophthalmus maximus]|uniref:Uncharacterized protein n=1 Tax=Scophthalmus maximus TaxID=52904 RepID=A0A6A4TKK3_SCOMX|nr:hypothetical protein F2P81_001878 [Scophthalmus maximus]